MKLYTLFFILLLPLFLLAQDDMETYDIWNGLGHQVTSADSVYYSGGLYIQGDDTLNIFIPVKKTNGVISVWGYLYNVSGASADTVYFDVSIHRGNGRISNEYFTHTYTAMDTAYADTGGTGQFEFFPLSSSVLQDNPGNYLDIRIYGVANYLRALYMKIEWIEQ